MSQDAIKGAIKELEEALRDLDAEMKKKKQAINVLYETLGEPVPYQLDEDSMIIRSDQFYGKPFATAASEFLKIRKRACSAEEILHGLEEGGFDFTWPQNDRLRSLAVSLGKNSTLFEKLPNNTYGLAEWYTNKPMRRTKPPKNRANNDSEETENLEEKEREENIEYLMKE